MVKAKVRRRTKAKEEPEKLEGPPSNRDGKRGQSMERAKERFLVFLKEHGSVRYACQCAKVSRSAIMAHRKKDPVFAQAWVDALDDAADYLEESMYERACDRDTVAGIFLLKGMRPEKYRERTHVTTVEEKAIDEAIEAEFRLLNEEAQDAEFEPASKALPAPGHNGNGQHGNGHVDSSTKESEG